MSHVAVLVVTHSTLLVTAHVIFASVAAGFGAVCRLLLDGWVTVRLSRRQTTKPARGLPWGTMVVNLSGSFIIGMIAGLLTVDFAGAPVSPTYLSILATSWLFVVIFGFLSGYTTFSTASHQTVSLARSGRWAAAALVGFGQLVMAVTLVAAGWAVIWVVATLL